MVALMIFTLEVQKTLRIFSKKSFFQIPLFPKLCQCSRVILDMSRTSKPTDTLNPKFSRFLGPLP